jgi:phosphonate transport system substrate-binding protein
VWRVLVHPLHNPVRLFDVYEPWVDELARSYPQQRWRLEASSSYAAYEAKLREGAFELTLPNPLQALSLIDAGHELMAMAGAQADFCGLILVPADSPVRSLADLTGRRVAYPAPTALAATLLPQWMLWQAGVHPLHSARALYVNTQESALLAAVHGQAEAAATWPTPWRAFQAEQPALARRLRVLAQSQTLPNNAVVAHRALAPEWRSTIGAHLFGLPRSEQGRALLARMGLAGFFPATAADYEQVREFLRRFEATIRPAADDRA